MAVFFIDASSGQVATRTRLLEAGIADPATDPPRPWHRIQGPSDATTMWYAVLRRRERGIFLGTLVFRHGDHHALLLGRGWQEVPVEELRDRPLEAEAGAARQAM